MLKKDHDFLSSVICFLPRVTISLIPVFSPFFRFPSHQMSIYKEQRYPSLNFPVPNIKLAPVCLPIEQGLLLLVWSCAQRLAFLWFSILNIICVQIYSASQLLFRKEKKTTVIVWWRCQIFVILLQPEGQLVGKLLGGILIMSPILAVYKNDDNWMPIPEDGPNFGFACLCHLSHIRIFFFILTEHFILTNIS